MENSAIGTAGSPALPPYTKPLGNLLAYARRYAHNRVLAAADVTRLLVAYWPQLPEWERLQHREELANALVANCANPADWAQVLALPYDSSAIEPELLAQEWLSRSQLQLMDQELQALDKQYPDLGRFLRRLFNERNKLADDCTGLQARVEGQEQLLADLSLVLEVPEGSSPMKGLLDFVGRYCDLRQKNHELIDRVEALEAELPNGKDESGDYSTPLSFAERATLEAMARLHPDNPNYRPACASVVLRMLAELECLQGRLHDCLEHQADVRRLTRVLDEVLTQGQPAAHSSLGDLLGPARELVQRAAAALPVARVSAVLQKVRQQALGMALDAKVSGGVVDGSVGRMVAVKLIAQELAIVLPQLTEQQVYLEGGQADV